VRCEGKQEPEEDLDLQPDWLALYCCFTAALLLLYCCFTEEDLDLHPD
jgi:hypothetical protein